MTPWAVGDWLLVIGAIGAAIVLVINALGTHWGRKEIQALRQERSATAEDQGHKLDVIHDLTNSSMTELKRQLADTLAKLAVALERIDRLEAQKHLP